MISSKFIERLNKIEGGQTRLPPVVHQEPCEIVAVYDADGLALEAPPDRAKELMAKYPGYLFAQVSVLSRKLIKDDIFFLPFARSYGDMNSTYGNSQELIDSNAYVEVVNDNYLNARVHIAPDHLEEVIDIREQRKILDIGRI